MDSAKKQQANRIFTIRVDASKTRHFIFHSDLAPVQLGPCIRNAWTMQCLQQHLSNDHEYEQWGMMLNF